MKGVNRTFRVSTRKSGQRRFVTVTVYDEIDDLRRAAKRHSRRTGTYRDGEFEQALGVTHSFQSVLIDGDGLELRQGPTAAHIRLWRGRLGTSVVTHEVCHAVSGIYQQDCLEELGSVHENMDNEEVFCYLLGDLSARIVDRLYRYGYYQGE